jgi:hypothetical protein
MSARWKLLGLHTLKAHSSDSSRSSIVVTPTSSVLVSFASRDGRASGELEAELELGRVLCFALELYFHVSFIRTLVSALREKNILLTAWKSWDYITTTMLIVFKLVLSRFSFQVGIGGVLVVVWCNLKFVAIYIYTRSRARSGKVASIVIGRVEIQTARTVFRL